MNFCKHVPFKLARSNDEWINYKVNYSIDVTIKTKKRDVQ